MNKEIKFRALRDDMSDYTWKYGSLVYVNDEYFIRDSKSGQYLGNSVFGETVGQFTGLQDKNGVDIYEGDIVEDINGYKGRVYYDLEYAGYCVLVDEEDEEDGVLALSSYYMEEDYYEVIGNIHENEELLND